jgi:hypothetical protein
VTLDLRSTRVRQVPSLVLVDERGIVRASWEPPVAWDALLSAPALAAVGR